MSPSTRRILHMIRRHRIATYWAIGVMGDSGWRDRCSCGADWAYA